MRVQFLGSTDVFPESQGDRHVQWVAEEVEKRFIKLEECH